MKRLLLYLYFVCSYGFAQVPPHPVGSGDLVDFVEIGSQLALSLVTCFVFLEVEVEPDPVVLVDLGDLAEPADLVEPVVLAGFVDPAELVELVVPFGFVGVSGLMCSSSSGL